MSRRANRVGGRCCFSLARSHGERYSYLPTLDDAAAAAARAIFPACALSAARIVPPLSLVRALTFAGFLSVLRLYVISSALAAFILASE